MEIQDGSAKFIVRDKRMQALVDMFYPVGSVYTTTSDTKPEFMNYGTWEEFAQGRTLVGAGTGTDSNNLAMTFNAGDIGGEYKHQLSMGEMPDRTDVFFPVNQHTGGYAAIVPTSGYNDAGGWLHCDILDARSYGLYVGDIWKSFNELMPYKVVHYYRRTS